jgi:hypothetical protein
MNYYNTTTVPTIEPTTELTPGEFFLSTTVPLVFTLGSMLGACIVFTMELFLYKNGISFKEDSSDDEDTSEDEDDDVDKDEIEEYLTQYDEEYEALPEKDFNNEDTVREMTPLGEVIMKYDRKAEAYSYYTDVMTDLTFEILETVAKKYAIYRGGVPPPDPLTGKGKSSDSKSSLIGTCANCVCACVCASTCTNSVCASTGTCANSVCADSVCASTGTCVNSTSTPTDSTLTGSTPTLTDSTPTGGSGGAPPFAKFKSYNTGGRGANPNYAAAAADTPVLNKAIHHFRFKGKLADYELEQSKTKVNDAGTPPMDYATFKKLMEITDKMKGI